jgi:hypothetical protein
MVWRWVVTLEGVSNDIVSLFDPPGGVEKRLLVVYEKTWRCLQLPDTLEVVRVNDLFVVVWLLSMNLLQQNRQW